MSRTSNHRIAGKRSASSLRVVAVKATPPGRARITSHDTRAPRGLDAAERTRTGVRVAAPEIVAQAYGSPEIDAGAARVADARIHIFTRAPRSIDSAQLQRTL